MGRGLIWASIPRPPTFLRIYAHAQTNNLFPAKCIRRHRPLYCVRIQVARLRDMFPGDMCPGVNAASCAVLTKFTDFSIRLLFCLVAEITLKAEMKLPESSHKVRILTRVK